MRRRTRGLVVGNTSRQGGWGCVLVLKLRQSLILTCPGTSVVARHCKLTWGYTLVQAREERGTGGFCVVFGRPRQVRNHRTIRALRQETARDGGHTRLKAPAGRRGRRSCGHPRYLQVPAQGTCPQMHTPCPTHTTLHPILFPRPRSVCRRLKIIIAELPPRCIP